jgi:hypothetical protein
MSRLCAVLAGIIACCVLMSHSGYAAQPMGSDSAQRATFDRDMVRPIEVVNISVDTVGLGLASKVSINVQCWPKQVKNVTARIVPDSGYEIIGQPQEMYSEPDTETIVFTAMIRATARGIWQVGLATSGICSDTTKRTTFLSDFFIQISDTLNRAMTFVERMRLIPPFGNVPPQPSRDSITVLPSLPGGQRAKPHIPDSLLQKRNRKGKRSGTFNISGYLLYHDARDPQGSYRAAVNCDVEVWNDNYFDSPSSSDTYLGTTITGWDGSISLDWLDNSDGDGTADPYFIFRTENSVWVVAPASGWGPYGWRTTATRDVCDDETVNLGTTYIFGGIAYYEQAMWCFQDINQGWNAAHSVGTNPSFVPCIWPSSDDHVSLLGDTIFISHLSEQAIDVVNHEYGHCLMLQAYSNGVIWGCNEKGIDKVECPSTAWREGWATFFALVVTQDGIMDYDTAGVGEHFPIEIPRSYSFAQGPAVAGRVAGALLDLWDTNNDGLDQNSSNTVTIGTLLTSGVRSHTDSSFYSFWSYLRNNELSTQQVTLGLNSIANNTIHFNCTSCGDANDDAGIDISDAVFLVAYIFSGCAAPHDCNYANGMGDANGDGGADISDAVYIVAYIFSGGPAPHCQYM